MLGNNEYDDAEAFYSYKIFHAWLEVSLREALKRARQELELAR